MRTGESGKSSSSPCSRLLCEAVRLIIELEVDLTAVRESTALAERREGTTAHGGRRLAVYPAIGK